jgi:hypothetical protein
VERLLPVDEPRLDDVEAEPLTDSRVPPEDVELRDAFVVLGRV